MGQREDWLASVEQTLNDGWYAGLSARWLERVYRDHGPISLAELGPLADIEEARHAVSAEATLDVAHELLLKVLADAGAVGLPRPVVRVEFDDWKALTLWIEYTPDGGQTSAGNCNGAQFFGDEPAELLAWLADNIQEVTMEGDQVHCVVWPVCTIHGLGGHARIDDSAAVWACGADAGHVIAPIGELAATLR